MRQRLALIITLIIVVIVLVALNAASYVRVERVSDSENAPDRSTFNSGATGTQAFYDFLHESGYNVVRWREGASSLLSYSGVKPAVFVVIGELQVPYSNRETREVLQWVESGGRLVIIDRHPDRRLLAGLNNWAIETQAFTSPWSELDPNDFEQMTNGVKPLRPSQPIVLARNVDSVMPSRFMGFMTLTPGKEPQPTPTPENDEEESSGSEYERTPSESGDVALNKDAPAPVVSLADERGALLPDYAYGKGSVVILSDPFIVANNGVGGADNLLLGKHVVAGRGGLIAFDEFHQGRATTHNALFQYFAGTPVLAICAQLMLIALAVVWSRGTRFARPLPLAHVDRRSSLEFVASMAELQQRAKAHDLALENIYSRVRRVLVRHAGLNQNSSRAQIAARVASRSKLDEKQLESLMRSCEDTINGAHTTERETLRLVRSLREIEARLGLQGRARDAKQNVERT